MMKIWKTLVMLGKSFYGVLVRNSFRDSYIVEISGALFMLRLQYGPYYMGILKLNVKRAPEISTIFGSQRLHSTIQHRISIFIKDHRFVNFTEKKNSVGHF